jgi:rfaE bifunctional protein kinase chain/domain
MNPARFDQITRSYPKLRVTLAGDFCLDRYLEIDPAKAERSIETGLLAHNVQHTRPQPGAAGTILNNLAALGIGTIDCIGFCGLDGEGWELMNCLEGIPGARLDGFIQTGLRRTFCYTKPLIMAPGKAPVELNRLDFKNWTPTPLKLSGRLVENLFQAAAHSDAIILMDQVDAPQTGVITEQLLEAAREIAGQKPGMVMVADSRRGLRHFPPLIYKMNETELWRFAGRPPGKDENQLSAQAAQAAAETGRMVFVTRAEKGILGAAPSGEIERAPALPAQGEIDIVGAGDSVTANLASALAAGAQMKEAMEIAMLAASVVIHQLGTTGTATVKEMRARLF